jgi:hypothetical protein
MQLFRTLNASDETTFRAWARQNYEPFTDISGTWHPVVQDECRRINAEAGSEYTPD